MNDPSYMTLMANASGSWCPESIAKLTTGIAAQVQYSQGRTNQRTFIGSRTCTFTGNGAVNCPALGSPIDMNAACGVRGVFGCYNTAEDKVTPSPFDSSYSNLRACSPVVTSNPVQCRVSGSIGEDLTATTDDCVLSPNNGTGLVMQYANKSVFGSCPSTSIGNTAFVFGSKNLNTTTELRALLGFEYPPQTDNLVVRCDIDVRKTFMHYQTLNFTVDSGEKIPLVNSTG